MDLMLETISGGRTRSYRPEKLDSQAVKIVRILFPLIARKSRERVELLGLEARSRGEATMSRNFGVVTLYVAGVNVKEDGFKAGN